MEMIARATIRGAKSWTGNLDGRVMDTGTIFVDVELRGEGNKGVATQALKCDSSAVVKGILQNPFPFIAELTMIETTNGKDNGDQKIVTAIKPMQRAADETSQRK